MPAAELDERIRLFEESLTKIEEQRIVFMNRLAGDERRLANSVRKRERRVVAQEPQVSGRGGPSVSGPARAKWSEEPTREAIAAAIPGFFEREFGVAQQLCEQEAPPGPAASPPPGE